MKSNPVVVVSLGVLAAAFATATLAAPPASANADGTIAQHAQTLVNEGEQTFRHDTFGDEAFWSDGLKLDKVIAGGKHAGVGDGVSPKTALSVGLKVDAEALPKPLVTDQGGQGEFR